MIIGINGKIGSGKDTVGKIIQCLTQGINSEKQIIDYCNGVKITGFDWKIKKFAAKLKEIASLITGIPVEKFEDQEFKKALLGEEWGTVRHNPLNNIEPFEKFQFNELMSVREFLQKLGTEAMRDGLHTNVWVNALFSDYKPACDKFESKMLQTGGNYTSSICSNCDCLPNWIITDMRFPNEMKAVEEKGGITIRVVRPKIESLVDKMRPYSDLLHYGIPMPVEHPSETSLDSAEFDYEIVNDAGIPELIEKVREILVIEKII
jgi:hypothetical protein